MRVVIATVEPPDPFGNAAARSYYVLLRGLVERGHSVTMLSTFSDPNSRDRAAELFPAAHYDLQCFAEGRFRGVWGKLKSAARPFSYAYSDEMRQALRRACSGKFDVVHLEHLWTGWLGWDWADRALLNVHYLFSSDLAGTPPSSHYDRLRRASTFAAERRILRHFPHVTGLTDRLVQDIGRIVPERCATVIPLGIDASLYEFSADDPPGPLTVGVIGNFSWTPTYQATVRVRSSLWPRIKAAVPGARLLIVGRDAVRRFGPSLDPDCEVLENVPDIAPYFKQLHVLLYPPPFGSGTKVKVQEAMAFGVPVVTNAEGGEGIPGRDGEHWGFAEDDEGLAQRTILLLRDPELRRVRRLAARALLEAHFGPTPVINAVLAAYASLASSYHTHARRPAISASAD